MTDVSRALQAKAIELGKLAIKATTSAGSGHPTTALSFAHLTAVLMYRIMRGIRQSQTLRDRIGSFFPKDMLCPSSMQPAPTSE